MIENLIEGAVQTQFAPRRLNALSIISEKRTLRCFENMSHFGLASFVIQYNTQKGIGFIHGSRTFELAPFSLSPEA